MIEKKVLIFFGSRFGGTEGISEKMAEILQEKGVTATVLDLKKTSQSELPDFSAYDGILIGSGIKVGQWTKVVKEFVSDNKDKLNDFQGASGFFVSSGYAADPEMYEKVKIEYTRDTLNKLGVKIDHVEAFGGLMDFTKSSRMSWMEKKLLQQVAKKDPKMDLKGWNDLRDWDKIEDFTLGFVELLSS